MKKPKRARCSYCGRMRAAKYIQRSLYGLWMCKDEDRCAKGATK